MAGEGHGQPGLPGRVQAVLICVQPGQLSKVTAAGTSSVPRQPDGRQAEAPAQAADAQEFAPARRQP